MTLARAYLFSDNGVIYRWRTQTMTSEEDLIGAPAASSRAPWPRFMTTTAPRLPLPPPACWGIPTGRRLRERYFPALPVRLRAGAAPGITCRHTLPHRHNWITDQYSRQPPPQLPLHDELPDGEEGLLQAVVKRIDQTQVRGALPA